MNTDIGIWLWSTRPEAEIKELLDSGPAFFEATEQALSRFRAKSELSRLNALAGRGPVKVSPILREAVTLALKFARATNGVFDPTILPALKAAGYVASFERLVGKPAPKNPLDLLQRQPSPRARWREVLVDATTIAQPMGVALDLGGVAKGWTVDRMAERLRSCGSAMVDAGGDIRAHGLYDGNPWPIAVADPLNAGRELIRVQLRDEAIATSSVGRRRWQKDGQWMHHLIDPRTQRPCISDLHTVSVIGPTAIESEVHAKVALVLGSQAGAAHLESVGLSGILIRHDGQAHTVGQRLTSM